jgi:hypothetical protein
MTDMRVTDEQTLTSKVARLLDSTARTEEGVKNICKHLESISEWQKDHVGRVHDIVDRRLSSHSARMYWIMGVGFGVSTLLGWLGLKK